MTVCYAMIEVPGIQQYITSTGKLKEMVGGSEIIETLSKDILIDVLKECNLNSSLDTPPTNGTSDWYIDIQRAAGTIRLVLPSGGKGKEFLTEFTLRALTKYPGLPILGALHEFLWDACDSLSIAGYSVAAKIAKKRVRMTPKRGLGLLPVCQAAKLDGAAAVLKSKDNVLSLDSKTRQDEDTIEAANKRLGARFDKSVQEILEKPDVKIKWAENFEDIFAEVDHSYMALIHIDGNDMGRKIEILVKDAANDFAINDKIKKFSNMINVSNEAAFTAAVKMAVSNDPLVATVQNGGVYTVPLRPLVMGGDDLTVVIRADLAFAFVDAFVSEFERITESTSGTKLTLGIGMLISHYNYPFAKAFHLAEELIGSAKKTRHANKWTDESVLDFLVLTGEMEADLEVLRDRIYKAPDGCMLTCKPMRLADGALSAFVKDAQAVATRLPRSGLQRCIDACRLGKKAADIEHRNMLENLVRGVGGRNGKDRMESKEFEGLFPTSFFSEQSGNSTRLIDLLEVSRFVKGGLDS